MVPPVPRNLFVLLTLSVISTGCFYDWKVGPEGTQDAGTQEGGEVSEGPVCQPIREAMDQKHATLSTCDPQQAFPNLPCQHTYSDECGCEHATSNILEVPNYENLIGKYQDAGCDAGCSICLNESWAWKCAPDLSGTRGTCVPGP
jgi:hypothetical protein